MSDISNFEFKKKFGQNFLKDNNVLNNIVEKSNIEDDTLVIEIGVGAGYLTKYIATKAKQVIGFEIDESLKAIIYNNLKDFTPTQRKFEWQAGDSIESVWDGLIQFRPSGIRVKKPTCFPALVALVQIPIIGKYQRRLTVREAARLQSFPDTFKPNNSDQQAYKQFGNAVNVKVIQLAAEELFNYEG